MGSTRQVTVTNGKWCVGTTSGYGIDGHRFEPFQRTGSGKYRRPSCYGKLFPTWEAASAYSVEHGFSQVYFCRPGAFIYLRLSPRTRKYLKSITDRTTRWDALEKLLKAKHDTYFQHVRYSDSGWKTRFEWDTYMNGDFKMLHQLQKGTKQHIDAKEENEILEYFAQRQEVPE